MKVHRVTLSKYVKAGIIKITLKGNGKYDYNEKSIYAFLSQEQKEIEKKNYIYARVSNPPRKYAEEQAQRVLGYRTSKGIHVDDILLMLS